MGSRPVAGGQHPVQKLKIRHPDAALPIPGHEFCPGGPGQNLICPVPGIPGQIQIGLANGNPGQATRDEVVQIQIGPANGSRDKRPGTALVPRSAPRIWPASPSP